jgi:hypothetical protein
MKSRVTQCSFCGKVSTDIGPMVEGPDDVYICAPCLHRSKAILLVMGGTQRCSFCGKVVAASRTVEGPGDIHMCAACVDVGLGMVKGQEGSG